MEERQKSKKARKRKRQDEDAETSSQKVRQFDSHYRKSPVDPVYPPPLHSLLTVEFHLLYFLLYLRLDQSVANVKVQPSSSADPGCLQTKTNMVDLVKSSAPQVEKSSRPIVPNNILHTSLTLKYFASVPILFSLSYYSSHI